MTGTSSWKPTTDKKANENNNLSVLGSRIIKLFFI
jgi:hypothetical protein